MEVINFIKKILNIDNDREIKKEIVMLSGNKEKEFVPVFDGNRVYYGGKQKWFDEEFYRKRGCGTVAASNITWYMSEYVPGCERLYSFKDISKDNYIKHMYEILQYIKPCLIGVPTVFNMGFGVKKYGKSKGVNLKVHYKPLWMDASEFIKQGLSLDSPVAMLQYYKSEGYNWHWQSITKYSQTEDGKEYIEASNWGRRYIYDFEPFKNNRFIYFTLE